MQTESQALPLPARAFHMGAAKEGDMTDLKAKTYEDARRRMVRLQHPTTEEYVDQFGLGSTRDVKRALAGTRTQARNLCDRDPRFADYEAVPLLAGAYL